MYDKNKIHLLLCPDTAKALLRHYASALESHLGENDATTYSFIPDYNSPSYRPDFLLVYSASPITSFSPLKVCAANPFTNTDMKTFADGTWYFGRRAPPTLHPLLLAVAQSFKYGSEHPIAAYHNIDHIAAAVMYKTSQLATAYLMLVLMSSILHKDEALEMLGEVNDFLNGRTAQQEYATRYEEVRSMRPFAVIDAFGTIFTEEDWIKFFEQQQEEQEEIDEEEAAQYKTTVKKPASGHDMLAWLRDLRNKGSDSVM